MWEFLKKLFRKPAMGGESRRPIPQTVSEDLLRSEARFRLLVEGVRDYAIFMLDPSGRILSWNAGAERIKGYRAEEIIGQHFSRFYRSEEIASGKPDRELEIAAAQGKYEEEGWRRRKDGSEFWASVLITALRDANGILQGFAKITRDMTERKQAEENARRLLQEEAGRLAAEVGVAEARRAQQEERDRREQLQVTLASIGDAVIVADAQGLVTFLNPVASALTGWDAREAAGRPVGQIFRIFNENTRHVVENPVARVLREGGVVGLENHTILIARDGREFPIDDSGAPIQGEDGTIRGVVLVFRDVTESRQSLRARLRLAAIVESSDDAILSIDLEGTILSWNRGAERLYGYAMAEVVGHSLSMLLPADHADDLPEILRQIRRDERILHYETARMHKDGRRIDVSLTVSPIKDGEGTIVGASKIARDISVRKRNEETLRFLADASKLLAELVDVPSTLQKVAGLAVPHFADWCVVDLRKENGSLERVAIAHVDPGKIELAYDLYRRYPPDPASPVGSGNILRAGKSELLSEIPDTWLAERARDAESLRALRELGLKSLMAVPLRTRGNVLGIVTFVAAESGRRYGPDDLRLAEDLAQRAAVAIENARLCAALKQADRRKDEFLAMLAHELRNPLAPIRNALHIMKMPGANGEAVEQARQMTARQVEYMVRLVDDLLDVSRIMRDRIELRKEPVEVATIVARAIETARPALDEHGQQLLRTLPAEPLWLEADSTRLIQVLANLLNNAAKFSSRADRIWLTAERRGNEAVLRVKDEGVGISPELLPHVFELFVQGDTSLDRSRGGLGIGLTVVHKLVEMHGGTVVARSDGAGRGSEFVVRLPALVETPKLTVATSAPLPTMIGRRVLVVDDNVDAAESLAMLLKLWGHETQVAYSGTEGLRKAETFCPEIVVLDIGLPEMNGYEVAQRLRRQPHFRQAVLVALTGYGQDNDRRRSADAGFDHHMTKPVDPEALQRIVAAAMRT